MTHRIVFANATFTRSKGYKGYWRWTCDDCGRVGLGDQFIPARWCEACARGHAPCPYCDRPQAVLHDGRPRVHTRCPNRPEDVQCEWDAAKDTFVFARRLVAEGVS